MAHFGKLGLPSSSSSLLHARPKMGSKPSPRSTLRLCVVRRRVVAPHPQAHAMRIARPTTQRIMVAGNPFSATPTCRWPCRHIQADRQTDIQTNGGQTERRAGSEEGLRVKTIRVCGLLKLLTSQRLRANVRAGGEKPPAAERAI